MKLSVILPGIRPGNWRRLYDSIGQSFTKGDWELIIIAPGIYPLPKAMQNKANVKWVEDWGSPVRCHGVGLELAQGEYISWAADDGFYIAGSLDIAFNSLEGKNEKTVVIGKYYEGQGCNPFMNTRKYYLINTHDGSRSRWVPDDCLMVMVGVLSRKVLVDIGGWDATEFEVCPMAYNDLSCRLYRYGCEFILQEETMFRCSHMPGHLGDHGPVHDAQTLHDEKRFRCIYSDTVASKRIKIDLNGWKRVPKRWERRFGPK